MNTMSSYKPLQRNWSLNDIFAGLSVDQITASPELKDSLRGFLLCDLCAESDSYNLYQELKKYPFSKNFWTFLEIWYQDELQHAAGFSKLIQLLYGDTELSLVEYVKARKPNFSEIGHFLKDEFKLLVLFAYDEHVSTMTYLKDTFYSQFGSEKLVKWIQLVAGDEARHFGNAVKLIQHDYQHRIHETEQIVNEILSFENLDKPYQATFLFDHDGEHFLLTNDEINNKCSKNVIKKIMRNS